MENFPTIISLSGSVKRAIAVMHPTSNNPKARGSMYFYQESNHVKISGIMSGLQPNTKYSLRIHEFGDTSVPSGIKLGMLYAPKVLRKSTDKNLSNLGVFETNNQGDATFKFTNKLITLLGLNNYVLGLGVGVHLNDYIEKDDISKVVSMGVIGVARPLKK